MRYVFLVDVDQTELFYWSTSWSTVDAVDVHFSDVFITPLLSRIQTALINYDLVFRS